MLNKSVFKSSPEDAWSFLLLIVAIIFGGFVRIYPATVVDFPLNDGGMFYSMTRDLINNSYLLPKFASYNALNIPFAYPPFGFYFTGFISEFLNINLIQLFHWLPPILAVLTIPVFFTLVKTVTSSKINAAMAALVFALVPRTYSWFIFGGGITRALYLIFYLLAVTFTFRLFSIKNNNYKVNLFLSILFNGLAVITHPEVIIHAITTGILIWLIFGKNRAGTKKAMYVGLGVLILTSIWWFPVIRNHGLKPMLSAFSTGMYSPGAFFRFLVPDISEEPLLPIFNVMAILGIGLELYYRRAFLILWFIIPLITVPRSAPAISILPLAIAAGNAIQVIMVRLFTQERGKESNWFNLIEKDKFLKVFLGYLIMIGLVNSFYFDLRIPTLSLSEKDREAMMWVEKNTEKESHFITLTGSRDPFLDPVSEWFPVLALRTNFSTIQGREWLPDKHFMQYREDVTNLQKCFDLACLDHWGFSSFDYIYIQKVAGGQLNTINNSTASFHFLLNELSMREDINKVFENELAIIFKLSAK